MTNQPQQQHHYAPTQIFIQSAQNNGFGAAGFWISLVSFLCCGIIAPMGLFFSIVGLFKAPRGMAVAGTILGALGSWWLFAGGFAIALGLLGLGGATKDAVEKAREKARQRIEQPASNQVVPDQPATEVAPESLPPVSEWLPSDQWQTLGDIRVRVVNVSRGKVPLERLGDASESQDELLSITLEIENTTQGKKLNYKSWRAENAILGRGAGTLVDEHDNIYKRIGFGFTTKPAAGVDSESIYPGKSIRDVLVFELPIEAATELRLQLPGEAIDTRGIELKLSIPVSSIGPEAAVLPDTTNPEESSKVESADEATARMKKLEEQSQKDEALRKANREKQLEELARQAEEKRANEKAADDRRWRTWTSGKFSIRAKFITKIGQQITLEKEDGTKLKISIDKLSPDDADWINHQKWRAD